MNNINEKLTFSVPLTFSNINESRQLSETQQDFQKKRQVFLNTLAVQVVSYYCQCLGVETKITQGDSWNWIHHSFLDVADLTLSKGNHLKLECRPILPDEDYCQIPLEAESNRVGYLLVEIDEIAKKGTILGFTNHLKSNRLYPSDLQSLEAFIIFMQRFALPTREYLEQLLNQEVWKTPEEVLIPSYRRKFVSQKSDKKQIRKAQIIEIDQRKLALIIHLSWEAFPLIDISVKIRPLVNTKNDPTSLPLGFTILLINSQDKILRETSAQEGDNYLKLSHQLPENYELIIKLRGSQEETIKKIGDN